MAEVLQESPAETQPADGEPQGPSQDTEDQGDDAFVPGRYAPYEGTEEQRVEVTKDQQNLLRELVKKMPGSEDKYARRYEVRNALRQRFFWRSMQYLGWDEANGRTAKVLPTSGAFDSNDEDGENRQTFNIYQGYGKSFQATFCQNAPNMRFEADDPDDGNDIDNAAESNKMRRVIEKYNPPKQLQGKVARLLWTDGRVGFHTRWVVDQQRFGLDKDGKPAGREVIEVDGKLEWKVPISINDRHEWPWAQRSKEFNISLLKEMYPDVADQIKPGASAGEDEYDRMARLAVMQGTDILAQGGDAMQHLGTEQKTWFRPSAFREIGDEGKRKELLKLFPEGCAVIFVGDVFCCALKVSMDNQVESLQALEGDGQDRNSMGHTCMDPQELFNDLMNLAAETFEHGIPATWYDQDRVDDEAINQQKAQPGNYFPMERATGEALEANFFQEQPAEVSAAMATFLQDLQGPLAQFLTGQSPALYGGNLEDQKTAHGYAMAKDQAQGLMGLVWMPFTLVYSNVMAQAVSCTAECRSGKLSTKVQTGSGRKKKEDIVSVDVDLLKKGSSVTSPETDENFPESWTQRSNKMMALVGQAESNPVLATILQRPNNLAYIKDSIGLEDLEVPGADSRDKQLEEIAELLEGTPITSQAQNQWEIAVKQAAATGQQPPPPLPPDQQQEPSVGIEKYDDDQVEFDECTDWINSRAGRQARKENPEGFQNVMLHAGLHEARIEQKKQKAQQDAQQMAAQAEQVKQAAKQQPDTPSESINFKDLPADGQIQLAAKAGITLQPQAVVPPPIAAAAPPGALPAAPGA